MTDSTVQPSAALKLMESEFKSKAGETSIIFKKLMNLLAEKEGECENLKYDLQDQTESRRHWHKRATEAESRFASVQHVLVIVDGNQTFFKSKLIRAGTQGTKEAVQTLVAEAKTFAREQHKNDLPENLSVIVHIFIDVGKLADDLSTANVLPEPDELWTFIQDASKLEPGITVSDCGSGHQAVRAKMKHFYELYLENCHCRHLFLALGRESEYYKVLETYADDSYTKLKTSLVKPAGGMPEKLNLPFHAVEFSALESVPRPTVFFNTTMPKINGTLSVPRSAPVLNEALPKINAKSSETFRPGSATAQPPTINGSAAVAPHARTISVQPLGKQSSTAKPVGQAAPSPRLVPPLAVSQNPTSLTEQSTQKVHAPASQIVHKGYVEPNGNLKKLEDSSSAGVVKLDTSSHSSHQSNKAADQSWENATTNSYVPAPISVPWGEEETSPQPVKHVFDEPPTYSRKTNIFNRRQPKQNGGGGGGRRQDHPFGTQSERRAPRQFEGSWDDMMQNEQPKASTQGSSPSPKPADASSASITPKSTDFSNAFTREVVTKPEPNPQARPLCAPIALNKLDQRIDLKLPRAAPADEAAFKLRTKNRHLCNEHHMRGDCSDIQCKFDHEEISDGVYLALRNKARSSLCFQGAECRRHDCYLSHHCPNVSPFSACGRPNCPFKNKGLHDIDLDIVEMIEPPKKKEA